MEEILIEIEVDKTAAQSRLIEVEKALIANRNAQEKLRNEIKQASKEGKEIDNQTIKRLTELQAESKKLNTERQRSVKAIENESNSINALRGEISKLTAERNNLNTATAEGRARFDELTKQLKEYNETVNTASKEAGSFKDNIGNYAESVKEAIGGTSVFGVKIADLGSFFKNIIGNITETSKAVVSLGRALLANPLFLIAAILAGIVGAFLATEKGVKKLEVALAPLKQAFNAVFSVIAKVGEFAFVAFEKLTDIIGSVTSAIGLTSSDVKDTVKALQEFEAQQAKIEAQQARLKAEGEKLRVLRDDETKSFDDRIQASQKLGTLLQKEQQTTIKFLRDRLAAEERALKTTPENLRTTEQIAKVEERRKELSEAEEDLAGRIAEQLNEQNSLVRDRIALQNEILQAQLDADIATGKVREGSKQALDAEIALIRKKADLEKQGTKDLQAQKLIDLKAQKDIADKNKEFTDAKKEAFQEFQDKQKELRDKALNDEIARLDLLLAKQDETARESLTVFAEVTRRKAEIEIITSEATADQAKLIRFNAEKEIDANAQQFFDAQKERDNEELARDLEYSKLEIEAKQKQYENSLMFQAEYLAKENEQLQSALDEELARVNNNFEQKRSLLEFATNKEIENIQNANRLKLELLENQFTMEVELFEIGSEQFAEAQQRYLQQRMQAEMDAEVAISGIKKSEADKRNQINELEKQSEANKANAIAGLAGTIAGVFEEQTVAGQIAGVIQAQVNAFLSASNVLKTLTGLGVPPPIPQIAAGATLAFGQKYIQQINAVSSGVQSVATSFNPALKFASGGRVPYGYEGKTTSGGDNTLALLKPNEVVLTPMHQAKLGGASTFAKIGVPGFASGGIVSQTSIANVESSVANLDIVKAIQSMPQPIVSVRDIAKISKQVQVKDAVGRL